MNTCLISADAVKVSDLNTLFKKDPNLTLKCFFSPDYASLIIYDIRDPEEKPIQEIYLDDYVSDDEQALYNFMANLYKDILNK